MRTKRKTTVKPPAKRSGKTVKGESISALSVELGVHRQTMKRVLRELQVKPVGTLKGCAVFNREEATAAMEAHREAARQQTEPMARLTMARARLTEAKAAILKRDHVAVATVREWSASLTKDITAIVRQLHLLAPSLAGLGVAEIDGRLKDVEHDLLTQLYGLRDPAKT
jgi:DNA-binding transcriptional regulator YhcF (GntR family)